MKFLDSMQIDPPPQTCFIKKDGILERNPGTFSSWKQCYLVITTEGFLHVFSSKEEKEPITTVNLQRAKVALKKDTRFDVIEQKKGLIGNKKVTVQLRAKTLGDMQDWMKEIRECIG